VEVSEEAECDDGGVDVEASGEAGSDDERGDEGGSEGHGLVSDAVGRPAGIGIADDRQGATG
jgi:hypothetical protein